MQSHELSDAFEKLKKLLDISGSDLSFENIIRQLELAMANSDMFDSDKVIKPFQASKNKDGTYKIAATDTHLVKNVKSVINLLISMSKINPEILNKFREYVGKDKSRVESFFDLVSLGVEAYRERKELSQFHDDLKVF